MPYRDTRVGSSNEQTADSEDEYEYEYDENETEVSQSRFGPPLEIQNLRRY
jgi:hypothetical protein